MKKYSLILTLLAISFSISAQQTINGFIMHDGIKRDYILYVPAIYTGDSPVPLVLNFHGYTSNANEQMWYGDFRSIADTANFIVVHPQGTLFNGSTHFNVGGWTIGSTVDDVGFSAALIDSLAVAYNINLDRVYSTGMSNGGFMSFLLACQLSEKIAAIASVTGSMTPQTFNSCNPQHPMPILQIHGTSDNVIPYTGTTWTKSIADVMNYWVGFNHCSTQATTVDLPNIDPNDGSTAAHSVYSGGDKNTTAEHFKITGGFHTWPGSAFGGAGTNKDFNASLEIWKFFSRYDLNSLTSTTSNIDLLAEKKVSIYPNPTVSHINIDIDFSNEMEYEIVSLLGERLLRGRIVSKSQTIDLAGLPNGFLTLKIGNECFKIIKME